MNNLIRCTHCTQNIQIRDMQQSLQILEATNGTLERIAATYLTGMNAASCADIERMVNSHLTGLINCPMCGFYFHQFQDGCLSCNYTPPPLERTVWAIESPDASRIGPIINIMRERGAPIIRAVPIGEHLVALEGSQRFASAAYLAMMPRVIVVPENANMFWSGWGNPQLGARAFVEERKGLGWNFWKTEYTPESFRAQSG